MREKKGSSLNVSMMSNSARNGENKIGGSAAGSSQFLDKDHKNDCHTNSHCFILLILAEYLRRFKKWHIRPRPRPFKRTKILLGIISSDFSREMFM